MRSLRQTTTIPPVDGQDPGQQSNLINPVGRMISAKTVRQLIFERLQSKG